LEKALPRARGKSVGLGAARPLVPPAEGDLTTPTALLAGAKARPMGKEEPSPQSEMAEVHPGNDEANKKRVSSVVLRVDCLPALTNGRSERVSKNSGLHPFEHRWGKAGIRPPEKDKGTKGDIQKEGKRICRNRR